MSEEEDAKSTKTKASGKTTKTRKSDTPVDEEVTAPVVEEEGGFKEFLWNPETRQFLGRTGKSWLDITIFYIVFFISLYCFVMLSWYVSLIFVHPREPYQHGKTGESPGIGAILYRKGPGLTMRPAPDRQTNGASSLIWFRTGVPDGHIFWSGQLARWMSHIPAKTRPNVKDPCTDTDKDDKACFVDKSIYKPCDGSDPTFGYSRGEPCILIKINRIYNWKPIHFTLGDLKNDKVSVESYDKEGDKEEIDVPRAMKAYFKNLPNTLGNNIYIWCEGDHEHDKENLGPIEYIPGPYIPTKYFPFRNQENYQSPFIMLKLKRPMPGVLVSIVCKAFAKNIRQSKETGVGYLKFQVFMGA